MPCCKGRAGPRAGPSVYACTASWSVAIGGWPDELSILTSDIADILVILQ